MIRPAQIKDASSVIDLVLIVLKDMELKIFDKLPEPEIKALLVEAYTKEPNHRYGYLNALVKEIDGEIAGVLFSYPHSIEETIDEGFINTLLANNLTDEYRLFNEKETFKDEWYLDTIVTSPNHRGIGVAGELLDVVCQLAKEKNYNLVGLNVDKINDHAKQVYLKKGFKLAGEITISNHQYEHLQKQIN